jgi:flagellar biosynthesis/type III secretory pathway protein FliH
LGADKESFNKELEDAKKNRQEVLSVLKDRIVVLDSEKEVVRKDFELMSKRLTSALQEILKRESDKETVEKAFEEAKKRG